SSSATVHTHTHLFIYPTFFSFFSFRNLSPTDFYTLSLHDALPILSASSFSFSSSKVVRMFFATAITERGTCSTLSVEVLTVTVSDRKSTRLNSSHGSISYAVFCLKKKKINTEQAHTYKKMKYITII